MSSGTEKRRRDPERRRREIIEAAAELVIEIGPAALTHRAVAARADVALGSTTQHFDTLDDLRTAALERLAEDVKAYVEQIVRAIEDLEDPTLALAEGLHRYLSESRWVRADVMLSAAATLNPDLRPLTDQWFNGVLQSLEPRLGEVAATQMVIFIGGSTWHAALTDSPPSVEVLHTGLQAFFTSNGDTP